MCVQPTPPALMSASFIPHCDYETCDLGRFRYTCPICNRIGDDYDVWFDQDAILLENKSCTFKCEHCGGDLVVTWDADECEFQVKRVSSSAAEQQSSKLQREGSSPS